MGALSSCCKCKRDDEETAKDYGMIDWKDRKCRDILFCILFALFWLGMIIIGALGLSWGDPARLVYGTDYEGNVCGSDDVVDSRKYTAYPRMNEDFLLNIGKSSPLDYEFYGVCVSECPKALDIVCNYDIDRTSTDSEYYNQEAALRDCIEKSLIGEEDEFDGSKYNITDGSKWCSDAADNCWVLPLNTSSVLFRCVPEYDLNSNVNATCSYPPGVTDPDSPDCLRVREHRTGTVERPAQPNLLFDQLNQAREIWGRYFGDLQRAAWVILVCSVVLGVILGFVWLYFLKWCTRFMVWFTIVAVLALLVGITFFCYVKGGVIDASSVQSLAEKVGQGGSSTFQDQLDSSADSEEAFRIMGYVMTVITLICVGLVVALRSKIATAIKTIQMASRALQEMRTLVLMPIFTVLAILVLIIWWLYVAASLASAQEKGTVDPEKSLNDSIAYLEKRGISPDQYEGALGSLKNSTGFATWEDREVLRYMLIYHFFGLLWTNQFIQGVSLTAIAVAVASWYFSQNKQEAETIGVGSVDMPRWPLFGSIWTVLRYHMGSIAMGSLLIAIVQFLRAVMAYVQRQLKQQGRDNQMIRAIFCVIQSVLKCIEWCLKVISRNAYIYVAVKGQSFCSAAGSALAFIISNLSVFAVINVIGEILMFLGKAVVAIVAALVAYALLDNLEMFQEGGSNEVTSVWLPVLVTLIFAFFIATAFFSVFDMCIDTLLICYVMDRNDCKNASAGQTTEAIHSKRSTVKGTLDEFQEEQDYEDKRPGNAGGSGSGGDKAAMEMTNPIR